MAKKSKPASASKADAAFQVVLRAFDNAALGLNRDDYEALSDLIRQHMQCCLEASANERADEGGESWLGG